MYKVLLVIFLIVVIALITLIILQQGKCADMGASYGIGSISNTLFNSSGSMNFTTRVTAILATLFFIISLALANINNTNTSKEERKWENLNIPEKNESAQLAIQDKQIIDIPIQ